MAAMITQISYEIHVPGKDQFGGKPFLAAGELAALGDLVKEHHAPRFDLCEDFQVDYLWRARGGTMRGEPILADCLKPGGLALHYSHADFVIVFSANHLEGFGLTQIQYEALMFEQLSKIGSNENTGSAELRPYDFSGFNACIEAYGPWHEDLRVMAQTIREQPGLFDAVEGDQ